MLAFIIIAIGVFLYFADPSYLVGYIIILFIIAVFVKLPSYLKEKSETKKAKTFTRALEIAEVDMMPGKTFEQYVALLLKSQGYEVSLTPTSGDFGVDIIAEKFGAKYAIQCKRQKAKVSRNAISDAVAGKKFYDCDEAMTVTNSYFSGPALEFAIKTDCILIDRDDLAEWIADYHARGVKKI